MVEITVYTGIPTLLESTEKFSGLFTTDIEAKFVLVRCLTLNTKRGKVKLEYFEARHVRKTDITIETDNYRYFDTPQSRQIQHTDSKKK
jgi:hypothetical protein